MLFRIISKDKHQKFIFVMRKLYFPLLRILFPFILVRLGWRAKNRAMENRERKEIRRDIGHLFLSLQFILERLGRFDKVLSKGKTTVGYTYLWTRVFSKLWACFQILETRSGNVTH